MLPQVDAQGMHSQIKKDRHRHHKHREQIAEPEEPRRELTPMERLQEATAKFKSILEETDNGDEFRTIIASLRQISERHLKNKDGEAKIQLAVE